MELSIFFLWYFLFFLLGIIGLPLANKLFPGWPDKGYAFSKYLGFFALGFVWWLGVSLDIFLFDRTTGIVLMATALSASIFYLYKTKYKLRKVMLWEELIFLVTLLVWGFIRSYNPRAEGTEKLMNFAFMNVINSGNAFPPADPWFIGGMINYYYLGHYLFTMVGKIGNIAIEFVYNLSLITIIAQTVISLFSILLKLFAKSEGKRVLKYAVATGGALWISFAGNLHYAFRWVQALFAEPQYAEGDVSREVIGYVFKDPSSWFSLSDFRYYFPDATRIIGTTINEFPAYSIVLGDVHGHYLGLPFLILGIALAISAYELGILHRAKYIFTAAISTIVVAFYGINSWDFITIFYLFTLIHLIQVILAENKDITALVKRWVVKVKLPIRRFEKVINPYSARLTVFVGLQLLLLLPGLLLLLPYILNYSPAVGPEGGFPIGIVPLEDKSEISPWLLFWGQFLIIMLLYLFGYVRNWIDRSKAQVLPLLFNFVAICLIIGVELVFLKDIFYASNPPYYRTNTVFKFYYHAWIFFGIAVIWYFYNFLVNFYRRHNLKQIIYLVVCFILFFASGSYIIKAVTDFYPITSPVSKEDRTLDGINFINTLYNEDFQMINWLRENESRQVNILEGVGDAYTYAARISSSTGFPTVVGWPTHQWQWRGSPSEPFARKGEVDNFYQGLLDVEAANAFLDKYDIEYIILGDFERKTYDQIDEEFFGEMVDTVSIREVFRVEDSVIYQVESDQGEPQE